MLPLYDIMSLNQPVVLSFIMQMLAVLFPFLMVTLAALHASMAVVLETGSKPHYVTSLFNCVPSDGWNEPHIRSLEMNLNLPGAFAC